MLYKNKNIIMTIVTLFLFYAALPVQAATGSLVEAVQLKKWIDNSYHTEKGERVLIIDVVPGKESRESWFSGDLGNLKKQLAKRFGVQSPAYKMLDQQDRERLLGHIPGAILNISHGDLETMERNDGPINVDHQVGSGDGIDELLRTHGITPDDVIVITSSQLTPWMVCPSRFWWTLYYWGFSPEKIKLLDGGNKAYALAGYKLERGVAQPPIKPSAMTVASFPTRRVELRVSLQEMIDLVDSGKTSNGDVFLLDARQPPAAFYLKDMKNAAGLQTPDGVPDIYQVKGFNYNKQKQIFTRISDKKSFNLSQMLFSKEANDGKTGRITFDPAGDPPIAIPNPFVMLHIVKSPSGMAPIPIPIGGRSADFDGIIKGAHLIKSDAYNLTVPMLTLKDNRFKSRDELRALFAKAGIDGKKPVILYCNSGANSSFYFYALHEVAGFENVRMYDGSWQEWANLTAYEPADLTYVRHDVETLYPSWPAMNPAVMMFSGENSYMEWNGTTFVNTVTASPVTVKQIKAGGSLKGNTRWDTLHRSVHVVFRPSLGVNSVKDYKTYDPSYNWPDVDTIPDYKGVADKITAEDRVYPKKVPDSAK